MSAWNPVTPQTASAPPLLLPAHLTALPFLAQPLLPRNHPAKTMLPEGKAPEGRPPLSPWPSQRPSHFPLLSPTVFTSSFPSSSGRLTQSILKEGSSGFCPGQSSKP